MRILITGSEGFIGKRLCEVLSRRHELVLIDQKSSVNEHMGKNIVEKAQLNLCSEPYGIEKFFNYTQPKAVIHLAAHTQLRHSIERPLLDAHINIIGSLNVLEACRKTNVKRVIYTSTGGARYGYTNFCWENQPIHPISPYGISKHTVEHYLDAYQHMYKIWPTTLCFGNVYGPGDDPSLNRIITLLITKALRGEEITIYGDGSQTRDFIYIDDVVRAIQCALILRPTRQRCYSEQEIINIGTETETSINDIIKLLQEIIPVNVKYADPIVGELLSTPLKCNRAKEVLGWEPKWTFENGLKATVQWFKLLYGGL